MSDFRSRVLGTIIGILSRGSFPKREPVAFLYNGVGPLPDIYKVYTPELQKEYQYALLRKVQQTDEIYEGASIYYLNIYNTMPFVGSGENLDVKVETTGCMYSYDPVVMGDVGFNLRWKLDFQPGEGLPKTAEVFWVNFNLDDADNNRHMDASAPVPVYE